MGIKAKKSASEKQTSSIKLAPPSNASVVKKIESQDERPAKGPNLPRRHAKKSELANKADFGDMFHHPALFFGPEFG